jgi:hypothetical protein
MLKNILLLIISIAVGALIIILGFLWLSPRDTQIIKIIIPKSLFSLENAPTDTLVGEIASLSGKVAWQSRVAPVAILINSPLKLQQGEEVDTYDNGNVTINFAQFGTITESFNTQVNLIQTLPENFVIEQKQGTITFDKIGDNQTSIIALDLLININSGQSSIFVDKENSKITVSIKTGLATVAFNDNANNTNVISIKNGDKYIFDDNTKTGVIKKL